MTISDTTVRAFTLGDLPLLQRLKSHGISLDSEEYLSRGLRTASDATLARLSMQNMGIPTLVVKQGKTKALGQFRLKAHAESAVQSAHIVFIAPTLANGYSSPQESLWLSTLDALSYEAGQCGAQHIHAEVDEHSPVFETLRRAGFASYARQDIWRRTPDVHIGTEANIRPDVNIGLDDHSAPETNAGIRWANKSDLPEIRFLHAQTVPRMAQQSDPVPGLSGLIYRAAGHTIFYLAVSEGERGAYIRPYIRQEDSAQAIWLLGAALSMIKQAAKRPVYCCVRQYHGWLGSALDAQRFTPWARQTVLVKHTSVRVKHPAFTPLPNVKGGITLPGSSTVGDYQREGITCLGRSAYAQTAPPCPGRNLLKGSFRCS